MVQASRRQHVLPVFQYKEFRGTNVVWNVGVLDVDTADYVGWFDGFIHALIFLAFCSDFSFPISGQQAIGMTVNFVNRGTMEELTIEEISGIAFIYNQVGPFF